MRQQDLFIKYWLRILSLPDDHILKAVYNELLTLAGDGHDNFARRVQSILTTYDINDTDVNTLTKDNIKKFECNFRENRYSKCINSWYHNLRLFPKLDLYRYIKTDYRIAPHILYITNRNHQKALTRLRVSSHNLNIELGRHTRPTIPRDQRICGFCGEGEIDNEIHFLMECGFHSNEREILFTKIDHIVRLNDISSTPEKVLAIMTSKDQLVLKPLGEFVFNAFKKRDSYVV